MSAAFNQREAIRPPLTDEDPACDRRPKFHSSDAKGLSDNDTVKKCGPKIERHRLKGQSIDSQRKRLGWKDPKPRVRSKANGAPHARTVGDKLIRPVICGHGSLNRNDCTGYSGFLHPKKSNRCTSPYCGWTKSLRTIDETMAETIRFGDTPLVYTLGFSLWSHWLKPCCCLRQGARVIRWPPDL